MGSPCSPRLASNSLGRDPPTCLLSVGIKGRSYFQVKGESKCKGWGAVGAMGECLPHMHPGIPTASLSMEGRTGQVHPGCNHHTSSLRAAPEKGSKRAPHRGDAVIAALRRFARSWRSAWATGSVQERKGRKAKTNSNQKAPPSPEKQAIPLPGSPSACGVTVSHQSYQTHTEGK